MHVFAFLIFLRLRNTCDSRSASRSGRVFSFVFWLYLSDLFIYSLREARRERPEAMRVLLSDCICLCWLLALLSLFFVMSDYARQCQG